MDPPTDAEMLPDLSEGPPETAGEPAPEADENPEPAAKEPGDLVRRLFGTLLDELDRVSHASSSFPSVVSGVASMSLDPKPQVSWHRMAVALPREPTWPAMVRRRLDG